METIAYNWSLPGDTSCRRPKTSSTPKMLIHVGWLLLLHASQRMNQVVKDNAKSSQRGSTFLHVVSTTSLQLRRSYIPSARTGWHLATNGV